MQNGHVESFNGRLRDECLNANWFRTLNDVKNTLASWRQVKGTRSTHLCGRRVPVFRRVLLYFCAIRPGHFARAIFPRTSENQL